MASVTQVSSDWRGEQCVVRGDARGQRHIHCRTVGTVLVSKQEVALEDAIGSHACSLEALSSPCTRVANAIPLGCPLPLTVTTVKSFQTRKVETVRQPVGLDAVGATEVKAFVPRDNCQYPARSRHPSIFVE